MFSLLLLEVYPGFYIHVYKSHCQCKNVLIINYIYGSCLGVGRSVNVYRIILNFHIQQNLLLLYICTHKCIETFVYAWWKNRQLKHKST